MHGSVDIVELTGKQHKRVLTDVRLMLVSLGFSSADFSAQYKDSTGRALSLFKLPKRETLGAITGRRLSELPIRQCAFMPHRLSARRFSELPIRQCAEGFRSGIYSLISELPIRQCALLALISTLFRVSELPIRQCALGFS